MNINKTSITWTDIVNSLIYLYEAPQKLLLQSKLSYIEEEAVQMIQNKNKLINPHLSVKNKNFMITSLYHQRFLDHLPLHQFNIRDIIQNIDIEQPKQYNLGRSFESAFAFTSNHQFVLKKISASNFYYFKRVFYKDYFALVDQGTSLLAKTYGIFLLENLSQENTDEKNKNLNIIHFILMENLFFELYKQPQSSKIMMIFDLKGATINRSNKYFKEDYQKLQNQTNQMAQTQDSIIEFIKGKDNDLLLLENDNPLKQLTKEDLGKLLVELERESKHLEQSNIMDYSIMMIVWRNPQNLDKRYWNQLPINNQCYISLGIIDYLQEYNSSKKMETKVKNFFGMFKQNNEISCVNSTQYRQRFLQYFAKMLQ